MSSSMALWRPIFSIVVPLILGSPGTRYTTTFVVGIYPLSCQAPLPYYIAKCVRRAQETGVDFHYNSLTHYTIAVIHND